MARGEEGHTLEGGEVGGEEGEVVSGDCTAEATKSGKTGSIDDRHRTHAALVQQSKCLTHTLVTPHCMQMTPLPLRTQLQTGGGESGSGGSGESRSKSRSRNRSGRGGSSGRRVARVHMSANSGVIRSGTRGLTQTSGEVTSWRGGRRRRGDKRRRRRRRRRGDKRGRRRGGGRRGGGGTDEAISGNVEGDVRAETTYGDGTCQSAHTYPHSGHRPPHQCRLC
jgi:hypothetical protein